MRPAASSGAGRKYAYGGIDSIAVRTSPHVVATDNKTRGRGVASCTAVTSASSATKEKTHSVAVRIALHGMAAECDSRHGAAEELHYAVVVSWANKHQESVEKREYARSYRACIVRRLHSGDAQRRMAMRYAPPRTALVMKLPQVRLVSKWETARQSSWQSSCLRADAKLRLLRMYAEPAPCMFHVPLWERALAVPSGPTPSVGRLRARRRRIFGKIFISGSSIAGRECFFVAGGDVCQPEDASLVVSGMFFVLVKLVVCQDMQALACVDWFYLSIVGRRF